MAQPTTCSSFCHGRPNAGNRAVESAAGAGFRTAPRRFDLRPAGLEGRQVRRVGGPIPPPDATPGQPVLEASRLVDAHVVQPDEVSRCQRRPQHLLARGAPPRRVHRPFHRHHGVPPVGPEGPQPRHVWPRVLRDGPTHPCPCRGTPRQAGHRQLHARRINAWQPAGLARGDHLPVPCARLLAPWRLTLRGVARLFVRGSPRRVRRRDMGGTLTLRPCRWSSRGQRSASVASACAPSTWRTAS
jgi:hypothetical protein